MRSKIFVFILVILTSSGILYSQQTSASDYEFIFSLAPGITTSLASSMKKENWAFTNGGQNIDELYSLKLISV